MQACDKLPQGQLLAHLPRPPRQRVDGAPRRRRLARAAPQPQDRVHQRDPRRHYAAAAVRLAAAPLGHAARARRDRAARAAAPRLAPRHHVDRPAQQHGRGRRRHQPLRVRAAGAQHVRPRGAAGARADRGVAALPPERQPVWQQAGGARGPRERYLAQPIQPDPRGGPLAPQAQPREQRADGRLGPRPPAHPPLVADAGQARPQRQQDQQDVQRHGRAGQRLRRPRRGPGGAQDAQVAQRQGSGAPQGQDQHAPAAARGKPRQALPAHRVPHRLLGPPLPLSRSVQARALRAE
mmetsp:Transcript_49628/g.121123  ORF Transcript_49628/g.121123 Transcript_49628/m.121123 type:complete len:294 (-) Transcript_49628:97-978(-)